MAQKDLTNGTKATDSASDLTQAKQRIEEAGQKVATDRFVDENEVRNIVTGKERSHFEALGAAWASVTGLDPRALIPQVVATVLQDGGTRPSWRWEEKDSEFILMAWPKEQALRAAVLMNGKIGGQLKPTNAFPLLEGLPNDLTVEVVHPWESGHGANVGCVMVENQNPMWFYDPLYGRDKSDLTPGVTQTFVLAGLAFGLRRALLDEITVTKGPVYEQYAAEWLAENPDKTRLDVPPLKIDISGQKFIQPGENYTEYQMRCVIDDIDDAVLDKMPIKIIYTHFPFKDRPPLRLPIYVSKLSLKDFEPKVGQEIDAYVWLQGRIIDFDPNEDVPTKEDVASEQNNKGND
ncbi:MAG: hypothetical protein IJT59_07070 [Desulfovibrionaceae bacterium]|nr:hypothetical protein [Desulfovibrionaceae bacterium]